MDLYHSPSERRFPGEGAPNTTILPEGLDLMSLTGAEGSAAQELLEMVLEQKSLPVRLAVTEKQNQLLWHFYSEQRSSERSQGYPPLGLGYPLLITGAEAGGLCVPILIWSLRTEPSPYRANEWEVYTAPAQSCRPHPRLVDWLARCGRPEILENLPPRPDAGEVIKLIQVLAAELDLDSGSQSLALAAGPHPAELSAASSERIHWSGLIGLFPRTFAESASTTFGAQVEALEPAGYPYGLLPQGPDQASALNAARSQSLTWVEGISGTGKTHLVAQIVGMALANGQKCLVVSPSAGNLKEIQDKLAALGIQRLLYLVRNPETETGMLLDFFRAMIEGEYLPPDLDPARFNLYLDRCEREKSKLDERYAAVKRRVFGAHDWTETVGLFLESNRRVGKELLGMQLYTQDFEFTYAEYEMLNQAIAQSQPLYQKVRTLKHPLSNLHPTIFLNREKEESRVMIADRLEALHSMASRLQRRFFSKVNQYGEALRKHYDHHYRELSALAGLLKEKMSEGKNRFGQPFEQSSERTLRLYGLFSKKQKEILQARQQIEKLYEELKQKFELFGYFDFEMPPAGAKPVAELRPYLALFEQALAKWQDQHASLIQDHVQRLSRKTIHPRLHLEEEIQELEDNLELLLENLNEAQLYDQPFQHNMLTIPKRQKYLEGVIEQLEETKRNLPDFSNFYDWQRNWLGLDAPAQKLVRALVKVKPDDWDAAFKSWYLDRCLNLAHSPKLPQADDGLSAFVEAFGQLQPMLQPSIARHWDRRRTEALRRLKSSQKKIYQTLLGRKEEAAATAKSNQAKLQTGLEVISESLPVLLIHESVVPYLPTEEIIYDYILVDEAHLLSEKYLAQLRSLGRRMVVLSDPSLENVKGALNWPNQWRAQGLTSVPLREIYHWRPGNLLQLAGQNEFPAVAAQPFQILFEQVGGRYDEQSQMNSAEAEALITLLNRIEKTPQRTYPVVGVVCLTKNQRNLINQLLFQIKKQNTAGAETIRQLERNGMNVYAVDELAGLHFDIVIISGVWGVANTRGELTAHIQQLDRPETLAYLYLLMGRGYKSIYALNSIPLGALEEMSRNPRRAGSFWYAHYMLYLRALAREDHQQQRLLVAAIRDGFPSPGFRPKSVFCDQIVQELSLFLRDQQLETAYEEAQIHFPIVVRPSQGRRRPIVVQPDAFFAHTPATDYVWEYERRKQLAELGYSFLPAWSVKWWRETSLEAKRTAAILLNLLEETVEPDATTAEEEE